jgi:acetyl-CoA acetyltransferase
MHNPVERRGYITGVGQSQVGRRLPRGGADLTAEAAALAVADSGLTLRDIDGISCFPAGLSAGGFGGDVGLYQMSDALGVRPRWFAGLAESPVAGPIVEALLALSAGIVNHVLCFRTVTEAQAQGNRARSATVLPTTLAAQDVYLNRFVSYGAVSAVPWVALRASQHFTAFGTTREQLGQIPMVFRENAARNPKAIYRQPLSLDEYLDARMISTPLCLYDCDVPVDASTVVILSRSDVVPDSGRAVAIEAFGIGTTDGFLWDRVDGLASSQRDAAQMLWTRTEMTLSDMDFGLVYDGFSFLALRWLEELGCCAVGEGGDFVEGGKEIRPGGALPLNPHGGQLSAGRTHGFGLIHEAVTQLRGEAGERQLHPARAAVLGVGGGPNAGAFILRRP